MKKFFKVFLFYLFLSWCCVVLFGQKGVISLVPSITQQIYSLGALDNLVGCTSFCDIPGDINIPIVASAIDVNVEKVVSLKPDIIFVSSLVKPQTLETFKKLGLNVKNLPSPKNFMEICEQFVIIGDLIGKKQEALRIIEQRKNSLRELKKQIPTNQSPKIFMEIGIKPLFTVTPNTFMDDYIRFLGGINIAHDMKHGTITRETVLVRNPDIIFIVSMGVMGEEEKEVWAEYKYLNAAENNKIFVLDANISSLPTPDNYLRTVEEMIRVMY